MPKVEIEEAELANLRESASQKRRYDDIMQLIDKNPSARAKLQAAVAEGAPEHAGPYHKLREEFTEGIASIGKKMDEFMEAQAKAVETRKEEDARNALERRWIDGRVKAREQGYTAEGLTALEEFMEKNGIADHELAIPAFERINPPPEPVVTGGAGWNWFDRAAEAEEDAAYKALMEGRDDEFLARTIPAALKEGRGG